MLNSKYSFSSHLIHNTVNIADKEKEAPNRKMDCAKLCRWWIIKSGPNMDSLTPEPMNPTPVLYQKTPVCSWRTAVPSFYSRLITGALLFFFLNQYYVSFYCLSHAHPTLRLKSTDHSGKSTALSMKLTFPSLISLSLLTSQRKHKDLSGPVRRLFPVLNVAPDSRYSKMKVFVEIKWMGPK